MKEDTYTLDEFIQRLYKIGGIERCGQPGFCLLIALYKKAVELQSASFTMSNTELSYTAGFFGKKKFFETRLALSKDGFFKYQSAQGKSMNCYNLNLTMLDIAIALVQDEKGRDKGVDKGIDKGVDQGVDDTKQKNMLNDTPQEPVRSSRKANRVGIQPEAAALSLSRDEGTDKRVDKGIDRGVHKGVDAGTDHKTDAVSSLSKLVDSFQR